MRRLSILVLALGVALYAVHLLADADPLASYVLRDGLVVAGLSAIIFGLSTRPLDTNSQQAKQQAWIPLLFGVVVIAAFLRSWRLADLPPSCVAHECDRVLQLAEGAGPPMLLDLLAGALYSMTGQGLFSLRLAGALIGIMTVPIFFLTAMQYNGQAGALLATLLLAVDPWHIWSSRSGDPWLLYSLLLCLLLGAFAHMARGRPSSWIGRGIVFSLCAFGLFSGLNSLPRTAAVAPLLAVLLHGEEPSISLLFSGRALLGAFPAALLFLGLGYAIRHAGQLRNMLLLGSFLVVGVWVLRVDLTMTAAYSLLLVLLPFIFLLIALAADAMAVLALETWRRLVEPRWLLAGAMVVSLLSARSGVFGLFERLDTRGLAGPDAIEMAMGRYLAGQLQNQADATTIYFAPIATLQNPGTRLLAGTALDSGQVLPLEEAFNHLLSGELHQNLVFLLPGDEPQRLDLLRLIFPGNTLERQADRAADESFFFVFQTTAQEVAARQGLSGLLTPANGAPITVPATEQLAFEWSSLMTEATPFTAMWQGSLLVPAAGAYEFAVEGANTEDARFTLHLDNVTMLDSGQGTVEQSAPLAQGFYRLAIEYGWNSTMLPPVLAVRWRRPGADWEIIPRRMLHNPPAPNIGLLATYYPGSVSEGMALDQRKELFIGPAVDLTPPYNVRWTGQVAAARGGEYLLATLADGPNQLFIDGRLLLDGRPAEEAVTTYSAGVIYLPQGWHTVEIYYATGGEDPEFQLLWQPPGSGGPLGAAPLSSMNLSPLPGATNPGNLPSPPPLVDPRLGNERFALSQALDVWQPQLRAPPANLPDLPFEPQWQVGAGCGAADDQLNQPHGVALDAERGRLFVADTANLRVAIYGMDGAADGDIQSDLFQEPFDVEAAPDGSLLILDALAQQVFRVERASEAVEPFPLATSFYRPRGLAVDPAGNLIVADTGGGRAVILQSDGQAAEQYGGRETLLGRGQPVDALWVDGALWAVSAEDGRLWRLDTGGSMTAIQPTNTLDGPHLAGLPDGRFFVSDPGRGLVLLHGANGQPLGQFAAPGVIVTPTGIDVSSNGDRVNLAVVDSAACTISLWQAPLTALPHGG